MQELIRFYDLSSSLSRTEFLEFIAQHLNHNWYENIIRQSLFKNWFNQLQQSGHINNIVDVNKRIAQIIEKRVTNANTQESHNEQQNNEYLSMDSLPNDMIGVIASFLEFEDYEQFEKCNRSIFIELRSNSTLVEIPTDEIFSPPKTHPDEYLYLIREEDLDQNLLTESMICNIFCNAQKISVSHVNDQWLTLIPKFNNVKKIAFDSTIFTDGNIIDLEMFNWDTINHLSFFSHPHINDSIWSGVDQLSFVSNVLQKAEYIEYFQIQFDMGYTIAHENEFIRHVVQSNILQNLKSLTVEYMQNKQNLDVLLTCNNLCHTLKSLSLAFEDDRQHKLSDNIKFIQLTQLWLCDVTSEDIAEIVSKTSRLKKLTLHCLRDWEWIQTILKMETLNSLYIGINDHNKLLDVMGSIKESLTNRQSFNLEIDVIANYGDQLKSFESDMSNGMLDLVEQLRHYSTHFRFQLQFRSKSDKHLNILNDFSKQCTDHYSTAYYMMESKSRLMEPFSNACLIISNKRAVFANK